MEDFINESKIEYYNITKGAVIRINYVRAISLLYREFDWTRLLYEFAYHQDANYTIRPDIIVLKQ